jgi:hypothetical protein
MEEYAKQPGRGAHRGSSSADYAAGIMRQCPRRPTAANG